MGRGGLGGEGLSSMHIIKVAPDAFPAAAVHALRFAISNSERLVLGLPTGRTLVPVYTHMRDHGFRFPAEAHAFAAEKLKGFRHGQMHQPPSEQGTVVIPGFHGGATWAGASFDPTTGYLYVNSNNVPVIATLKHSTSAGPAGKVDPAGGVGGGFHFGGYGQFLDKEGYPAVKPRPAAPGSTRMPCVSSKTPHVS